MSRVYTEKKNPIAFVDDGNTFDLPNYSGVRKHAERFNQLDFRHLESLSGTTSGIGVLQSISIAAGTFGVNDVLEFVWDASTSAATGATITLGFTANGVTTSLSSTSIATNSRGSFVGQLTQAIEATDIGIIMHRGVTASGSQIGVIAEGDTNSANWITGAFTLNITPSGGDGTIYWNLRVYKRKG